VAKFSQFPDGERRIVSHDGQEIGVFHWQGKFYAYENLCLHQGGPACEGIMMHKVEDVIGADRTWHGQRFSDQEIHFVCPWHGYEYDLKTGECAADRSLKLKSFDVGLALGSRSVATTPARRKGAISHRGRTQRSMARGQLAATGPRRLWHGRRRGLSCQHKGGKMRPRLVPVRGRRC
ncbi:MAG: Rieske (2Fe-2S) protein, partial [Isosphaeraceae bacterium]